MLNRVAPEPPEPVLASPDGLWAPAVETRRVFSARVAASSTLLIGGTTRVMEIGHHVAELRHLRARDGVFYVTGNHEYYSRGTGFWGPPMRVFAPAEITRIRLYRA